MNTSFYDWYQPRQPRYPVQNFQPTPTAYSKPSPTKVVSIPVRFVRSESTRSESAVQIQKVFRGFMARLRVKQLTALKREVDEVESDISNTGAVEILRIDAKERLRLNERLMSLLLKLDSVRGTVSGVRDCRKAVIRKAIALQERIDAIATTTDDQTLEMKQSIEGSLDTQAVDEEEAVKDEVEDENVLDIEIVRQENALDSSKTAVKPLQSCPTPEEESEHSGDRFSGDEEESVKDNSAGEICNCEVQAENVLDIGDNTSESSIIAVEPLQSSPTDEKGEERQESEKEDSGDHSACDEEAVKHNSAGESCTCDVEAENVFDIETIGRVNRSETSAEPVQSSPDSEKDSDDHSVGVAERYTETEMKNCRRDTASEGETRESERKRENEKLMAKLLENNEVQMKMIKLLMERVEQLERAFLCEKLQKMKKKEKKKKLEQRRYLY